MIWSEDANVKEFSEHRASVQTRGRHTNVVQSPRVSVTGVSDINKKLMDNDVIHVRRKDRQLTAEDHRRFESLKNLDIPKQKPKK